MLTKCFISCKCLALKYKIIAHTLGHLSYLLNSSNSKRFQTEDTKYCVWIGDKLSRKINHFVWHFFFAENETQHAKTSVKWCDLMLWFKLRRHYGFVWCCVVRSSSIRCSWIMSRSHFCMMVIILSFAIPKKGDFARNRSSENCHFVSIASFNQQENSNIFAYFGNWLHFSCHHLLGLNLNVKFHGTFVSIAIYSLCLSLKRVIQ